MFQQILSSSLYLDLLSHIFYKKHGKRNEEKKNEGVAGSI